MVQDKRSPIVNVTTEMCFSKHRSCLGHHHDKRDFSMYVIKWNYI